MKTDDSDIFEPVSGGDDPTVDELIDDLSRTMEQLSVFRGSGYREKVVEADPDECPEDLIAPESLISDEESRKLSIKTR